MSRKLTSTLITKIEKTLTDYYGVYEFKPHGSGLEVLISTILSQNTTDVNSGRAYRNLRKTYRSWTTLAEADLTAIEAAIKSAGLANHKAKSIKAVLERIKMETGRYSLTHLSRMNNDQAMEYLTSFPGVGQKTAACVLLFTYNREIMPVDTHIHRITVRLGFVLQNSTRNKSFQFWFGQTINDCYTFHLNLILHGRQICKSNRPRCDHCIISNWCKYFTEVVKDG